MPDLNCYCIKCKQPLMEIENHGRLLTGCVNCNVWWAANGAIRQHQSPEQLRALNQALSGTPDVITG